MLETDESNQAGSVGWLDGGTHQNKMEQSSDQVTFVGCERISLFYALI
jgi:hypothetical protein